MKKLVISIMISILSVEIAIAQATEKNFLEYNWNDSVGIILEKMKNNGIVNYRYEKDVDMPGIYYFYSLYIKYIW